MSRLGVAAVVLCAIAFALRLWHLEFQSLWWDEGVTIYLAGQGVRALTVDKDFAVDLHPPLYHLALAGWTALAGSSVLCCRLLSVFGGVITVPLTMRSAATLLDAVPSRIDAVKSGGLTFVATLAAGVLATVSPVDVFYSQESRMYSFLPVLGALSLLATVRLLRENRWRHWLGWVAINLVAVYFFYYLGLLVVAEALALLALGAAASVNGALSLTRRWAVSQLTLVVGFAPWVFVVARRVGANQLVLPAPTEVHLTPWQFVTETWAAFTIGFTLPPGGVALTVLWAFFALAGIAFLARHSRSAAVLTAIAFLLPVAMAGVILAIRPFYYPRFVLFGLVPLWSVVAIGVTDLPLRVGAWMRGQYTNARVRAPGRVPLQLARQAAVLRYGSWTATGVLIAAVVAGNGWTWYHERTTPRAGYAPDDYRAVFASVSERLRAGDLILGDYPWQAGYAQAYFSRFAPRVEYVNPRVSPAAIANLAATASRIWVLTYSPDRSFTPDALETALTRVETTTFVDQKGDSRVRLVQAGVPAFSPDVPVATFDREIGLERTFGPTPERVTPGASISETLRWRALTTPSGNYTVFVHLVGPDGKLWGQVDSPPIGGSFPTDGWAPGLDLVDRYAVSLKLGAPLGTYQVEVGLYRLTSGQRLAVGPAPVADNSLVVGSFEVVAR
jgi:hypothetical protein